MSYIIQHVTVEGLWGVKSFDTDFHTGINILIGQNGSNKTTFLNLIEACLMVDKRVFMQIPFKKIVFQLISQNGIIESLIVEHVSEEKRELIRYYIPNEGCLDIVLFGGDEDERFYPGRPGMGSREIMRLREILHKTVKMSWLSVDRFNDAYDDRRGYEERRMYKNVVDLKLENLLDKLSMYRLQLVEQTNKLTNELNQQVLSLLLYDDETDNFDVLKLERFASLDPKEVQTSLYRVFKQMGNMEQMKNRIQVHIDRLTDAVTRIKAGGSVTLTLNDAASLVLIGKTLRIIELSKTYKEAVDNTLKPITNYQKILKKFIKDKNFNFSEDKGYLEITWANPQLANKRLSNLRVHNLSSGEKQLLILLTQTRLQENAPYIFIADEPELSLHIEWQKYIIGAINELNPNAQVIVATHSPEIAGQWSKNIIRMESITRFEDNGNID